MAKGGRTHTSIPKQQKVQQLENRAKTHSIQRKAETVIGVAGLATRVPIIAAAGLIGAAVHGVAEYKTNKELNQVKKGRDTQYYKK